MKLLLYKSIWVLRLLTDKAKKDFENPIGMYDKWHTDSHKPLDRSKKLDTISAIVREIEESDLDKTLLPNMNI